MSDVDPQDPLLGREAARWPPRAALVAVSSWIAVCGVLAKLWRAVDLVEESGALDGFVWLPLGLAAEVLSGALVALAMMGVVALVPGGWPRRRSAIFLGTGVLLGLVNIWWLAFNLVSFTITQAPITFQRLRGDEGVHFRDANLVSFHDVEPAILFSVASLAALPLCAWLARRLVPRVPRFAFVVVVVASLLAYASDAFVFRARNFGVADNPAFNLVSSFVHGYIDERRSLEKSVSSKKPLADLLVSRTPAHETPPPPMQKPSVRNVIVFFSEGIAREHTSLAGTGATPNLERRFHESGLEVTRYHSPFHKSIAAIYSYVCSDFPPPSGTNVVEINPRIDCGEMSEVLAAQGVHVGLFHGGDFGFYDKLGLLGMRGYEVMKDARVMSDPANVEENEWGIDDRAMVDNLLEWIDTLEPGDRFAATLIPITAHYPYWIPEDAPVAFPGRSGKARFLSAVHFLDEAFERMMAGLEARGLADDTAVIYLADHGETVGEPPRASPGRRLAYEPSLHVPFVILAPGMWPGGSSTDRLVSHVDLLPTILDLMGMPPDPRHHGTSILAPDREPSRIFIAANNGPRWVGFIDGDEKIIINRTTGAREAYDLAADPDERKNLIDTWDDKRVAQLEQEALAFADGKMLEIQKAPKVDAELDLQSEVLAASTVRVLHDGNVTCTPKQGTAQLAACPDDPDAWQGRKRVKAPGRERDCVLVATPRNGAVQLEVKDQKWFPLFARVRVAMTGKKRASEGEKAHVAVAVDGQLENAAWVAAGSPQRISFPPPRESVVFTVEGEGEGVIDRDVCLTFTDRAWRGKSGPDDDE